MKNSNLKTSLFRINNHEIIAWLTNSSSSWTRWKIAIGYLFNRKLRQKLKNEQQFIASVSIGFGAKRGAIQYANSSVTRFHLMLKEGLMIAFLTSVLICSTVLAISHGLARYSCPLVPSTLPISGGVASASNQANCGYNQMLKFDTKLFEKLDKQRKIQH